MIRLTCAWREPGRVSPFLLGIACVNGIEGLLGRLTDGNGVTVDGHLGIVTVGPPDFALEGVTL